METKKKTYLLTLFFALLFAFFLVNSYNTFFLQSLFNINYTNLMRINTNTIINLLSNILLFVSLVFLLIYYIESNIEKKKRALTLVYLSLSCTSIILILTVLNYTLAPTLNNNYYFITRFTRFNVASLLTIVNLLTFVLKIPFIVSIIICCAILIFKTIACLNIKKLFKIILSIFTGYLVLKMFSIFVILPFLLQLFKFVFNQALIYNSIPFGITLIFALLEIHIKLSNILLAFICLMIYIVLLINIFKKKNCYSKFIKCLSLFIPIIIILLSIVIKIITYFLTHLIPLLILLINYL